MGLPGLKVATAGTPATAYGVLRAAIRRSGVVPLLVMVTKPPPALAVGAVARVHGWLISSEPSL